MTDISISQSTFAALLLAQFRPPDDDPGFDRWQIRRPPKLGWPYMLLPDSHIHGSLPETWTPTGALADILQRAVHLADAAEAGGSTERAMPVIEGMLSRFVDDWCPTPPRVKWPPPPPDPFDLLKIGAVLQRRSEEFGGQWLGELLGNAARKFLQTGLDRIAADITS